MQPRKKSFWWVIFIFITFATIACTDDTDYIVTTSETISKSEIVGIWTLTEISYYSSGTNISLSPTNATYSLSLKFWENNIGQILSFSAGTTQVQDISWNIQGGIIIIFDSKYSEYIHCEFNNQCLCLNYAYTTPTGEQVLALYTFTKEN